ncbi:threonine--tRNA ligase [Patescibacteria group bacterium]|nr:threonine--tRNA ligase [Patescibacteria group bacterium]
MKIETTRHSLAHIMAYAVQELFPRTKFGIGPAIENGFYYDFDLPRSLTPEDLPKIEEKMKKLIKENLTFRKRLLSIKKAKEIFKNQSYKLELIKELAENGSREVSIYQVGNFIDLCKGPHVRSTKEIPINAFKLTKIAGAYWRGNEKNPMLQRIYGVAFKTKKELADFLKIQEKAEKRDHRKIGKELDLFSIKEEVGAGLVLWHPKGAIIRNIIEGFWRKEHRKRGYWYVYTPHIANIKLWEKSGHTKFYKENMYPPMRIEETDYQLKPMNCLAHVQIYKNKIRSYRDLPIRYCELGTVYRYEKSGVLHGILRPRGFTQDDSHIFCQPNQITEEVSGVLDLTTFLLSSFGFKKYEIDLSVRDPKNKSKYLGDDKIWKKAEKALEYVLKKKKLKYIKVEGEAVFYGPKIDIKLVDAIGRPWQGPTIQVDFNFPEKFDLNFINQKGKKQRVVMIHRTVLGSMERFLGCLLENYGGALPLWLSPEQIWVIPVGARHKKYAQTVREQFSDKGFRVELKDTAETVSKKIREGEIQKIPYLLVVGDKEVKTKSVRVRKRKKGDIGEMKVEKFLKKIKIEIEKKK